MTKFLRDMIAIPSESCGEKEVVLRIKEEIEKAGFDKIEMNQLPLIFTEDIEEEWKSRLQPMV